MDVGLCRASAPQRAGRSRARARLEDYRRRDLAGFAADVREGRPDVIVVEDQGTREWVAQLPETAGVLDGYEKTAQAEEIEIWTRKAR